MHLRDGPRDELCRAGPWNAYEAQSLPSRVTALTRGLQLNTCPAGDGPGKSLPGIGSSWELADIKGWGPSREPSVPEETCGCYRIHSLNCYRNEVPEKLRHDQGSFTETEKF